MKLSINLFTTLDGVSQGPGSADEDTRGDFTRGGWLMPFFDEGCGQAVNSWYQRCGALLLGRRTFDTFASHWPHVTDPADAVAWKINNLRKYVVTSSPLGTVWEDSSTILGEGFLKEIARFREADDDLELQVHGSIHLARTLHEAGLVDIYRFLVAPAVVGGGSRVFGTDGPASAMRIEQSTVTSSGVLSLEMTPRAFDNSLAAAVQDGQDVIVEQ
ncbi:dihydrofolate reductase family protein [Nesterenkonia xinjiangensis]|uniref:Dihydrofolate reductase n=1 Tax=Nesterenkonia xinjiangensis TaxID=225327 RepID=A0A7Z0GJ03_9MICC|nr:dihydrofolate reductase family protein [Nesterenkonia xinjiangensis]NYJ76842.1 dihydrofolate reductase [Nesterenkonia xinjiangensis]